MRGLSDEEYVYFFFREQAVEYINCGKVTREGNILGAADGDPIRLWKRPDSARVSPDGMTGQICPASFVSSISLALPS